jgi:hypothetical protein
MNQPRSEYLYRARMGLSSDQHKLLHEPGNAPQVQMPTGPFAGAWRNYIKSLFVRGFWYKLSSSSSEVFYVSENKTLAGQEERHNAGEASGRKLALTFFEDAGRSQVRRVNREGLVLNVQLLTPAEVLMVCGIGIALPLDPERTAADTELLLLSQYEDLDIERLEGTVDAVTDDVHIYNLGDPVNAEVAYAGPTPRTKMVLARALQRSGAFDQGETLQSVWALSHARLETRAAPHLPVPAVLPVARGRGRGRGRART